MPPKRTWATLSVLLVGVFSSLASAQSTTITFDDLPSGSAIANGYSGLDWNNFYVQSDVPYLNGSAYGPGYISGAVSPPNVGFDGYGTAATIGSVGATGFDLTAGYFAGAFLNAMQVTATATFENGSSTDKVFTVGTTAASYEVFDWQDLASVSFSTSGGTPANGGYTGTQFTVDNLTVASVPEPSTDVLLLAGLGLVGYFSLRNRRGGRGATGWQRRYSW